MNVIWWFTCAGFWLQWHLFIGWMKRREKESLDKKKRQWKESDVVSLVFLVHHECTHVKHGKQVSVWIGRGWWWKSGRQGEKSGRKRGGKKGEREKVVLGKALFVFVWLCLLRLPFFSCTTPPPLHNTRSHSPTTHHTTWRNGAHHHMQTEPCAVLPFLGVDSETHTASSTPHTPSLDIMQHTSTTPAQTKLMVHTTNGWQ